MDGIPTAEETDAAVEPSPYAASASCAGNRRDPLLGRWADESGNSCEFFSNGRYIADCGVLGSYRSPSDFSRLDDGRYYFGHENAFGENVGECIGTPTFKTCDELVFHTTCDRGDQFELKLLRQR